VIRAQPLGRLLRADLLQIGNVTGNATFDDELIVDLDPGKELLDLDRKVGAVLLRILLLDRKPWPVQVLVESEGQQRQEENADHQEGST
jgi:hypothetical protein